MSFEEFCFILLAVCCGLSMLMYCFKPDRYSQGYADGCHSCNEDALNRGLMVKDIRTGEVFWKEDIERAKEIFGK
jgi:hypothetical protein